MRSEIKMEGAVLEAISENRDFIFTGTTEESFIKLNYYFKNLFCVLLQQMRLTMQLEIEGIGQQKYTLSAWKSDNNIYTLNQNHVEICPWICWGDLSSPIDFISEHGEQNMGYGDSEKEAILAFCSIHKIRPPFWW